MRGIARVVTLIMGVHLVLHDGVTGLVGGALLGVFVSLTERES